MGARAGSLSPDGCAHHGRPSPASRPRWLAGRFRCRPDRRGRRAPAGARRPAGRRPAAPMTRPSPARSTARSAPRRSTSVARSGPRSWTSPKSTRTPTSSSHEAGRPEQHGGLVGCAAGHQHLAEHARRPRRRRTGSPPPSAASVVASSSATPRSSSPSARATLGQAGERRADDAAVADLDRPVVGGAEPPVAPATSPSARAACADPTVARSQVPTRVPCQGAGGLVERPQRAGQVADRPGGRSR